jgi:pSer/pThr/pTyr-binding forkhead associated (FHA) protein
MTTDFQITLLVAEGAQHGRKVPVSQLPFLIGRASDCHLRPSSPAVSNHHCVLLQRNGRLLLADLGSTNGTFLNGTRLVSTSAVGDGDELAIGPLRFRLRVEAQMSLSEPSVEDTAAQTLLDGTAAVKLPEPVSTPPIRSSKTARMRRTTPAAAARTILERMRRDEKHRGDERLPHH